MNSMIQLLERPDFSQVSLMNEITFKALNPHHQELIQTTQPFTITFEQKIAKSIEVRFLAAKISAQIHPFEEVFKTKVVQYYCREIVFLAGNQSLGFARSLLALPAVLGDFEKQVMKLKNQSLSSFLYAREFSRTPFRPIQLNQAKEGSSSQLVGRTSVFETLSSELLITEVWFLDLF